MFSIAGILMLVATAVAYAYPRIRRIETELPDVVEDMSMEQEVAPAEGVAPEPAPAGS
jgi:hypothetical protein